MSHPPPEHYGSVAEFRRDPEGAWFAALLPDGTPVYVLLLAPELTAKIRDEQRCFETLGRAATARHRALVAPVRWGRTADGTVHVAFPAVIGEALPHGATTHQMAAAGVQLLEALGVAHATGIAHGAITPRHVLRTLDGFVLADFGLAAALLAGGVPVEQVVDALGDDAYVAPEVQAGSEPDVLSDIYALGAVLYEYLTGKPPFGGRTTAFVLASVLAEDSDDSEAALDARPGSSPVVDALLRSIERQPEDRWRDTKTFAQALAVEAASPAAVSPTGSKPSRRPGGCLTSAAAILVAVATLVALTI